MGRGGAFLVAFQLFLAITSTANRFMVYGLGFRV